MEVFQRENARHTRYDHSMERTARPAAKTIPRAVLNTGQAIIFTRFHPSPPPHPATMGCDVRVGSPGGTQKDPSAILFMVNPGDPGSISR